MTLIEAILMDKRELEAKVEDAAAFLDGLAATLAFDLDERGFAANCRAKARELRGET